MALLFSAMLSLGAAEFTGSYSPQMIVVGGKLSLVYQMTNDGDTPLSETAFSYQLPPSAVLLSAVATNGVFGVTNDTVSYAPETMAPGQKVVLQLTLTPVVPGSITNMATWAGKYSTHYINIRSVLPGPPLNVSRVRHLSTLLQDGRVLLTGGDSKLEFGVGSTDTCEIYNPVYDSFTPAGKMRVPRRSHTATLLPDGRVLVAGGEHRDVPTAWMDIFDPVENVFKATASLGVLRSKHTATLLPNGHVILAGGAAMRTNMVERFCMTNGVGVVEPAGNLAFLRSGHVALLLPGGQILFAGGAAETEPYAEVFDPSTGHSVPITSQGHFLPAVAASQGKVFMHAWNQWPEQAAAYFDVHTKDFVPTTAPAGHRQGATYLTLRNGDVLVIGGLDSPLVDVFNPRTGAVTASYPLSEYRYESSAVELADGRILVSGGVRTGDWTTSEIYAIRLDMDHDGMDDAWELANHFDPTRRTDAIGDADGEGHTNLQEFLAGTDPQDPNSVMRIETGYRDANTMRVRFTSAAGKLYKLERTAGVTGEWTTVKEHIPGTGGIVEVSDPLLDQGRQMYRVALEP